MAQAIQVAVRVRPFNERERNQNSVCVIAMDGNTVTIHDENEMNGPGKTFTFDHAFWSHDQFVMDADGPSGKPIPDGPNSPYISQRMVFDRVGKTLLDNVMEGFNTSIFAYGQTGSGKTFSMVGAPKNDGLIPTMFEEIFKYPEPENTKFLVECITLEIYMEQLRDLQEKKQTRELKIREGPTGVYVEGVKRIPCLNAQALMDVFDQANMNRTVAATNMNKESSRAHTVVQVIINAVKKHENGQESIMPAFLNLVDLAGSERANSTGASGDRLNEACKINSSLSNLGRVIKALAKNASLGPGKKPEFVPYRESQLTKLLKDALGGNSKTIMYCALSPASINYDETLQTLKYADEAKKIKCAAVKQENPVEKMIKELKAENERLKKLADAAAANGGLDHMKALEEERKKAEDERLANVKAMEEMQRSWEARLKEAQEAAAASSQQDGPVSKAKAMRTDNPRLVNIHSDPTMSECLVYIINKNAVTTVGSKAVDGNKGDIVLRGLNVKPTHCTFQTEDWEHSWKVVLAPADVGVKLFRNGDLVSEPIELHHHDRLIIGNNNLFRFDNPREETALGGPEKVKELETKQLQEDQAAGLVDEDPGDEGAGDDAYWIAMGEFNRKQGARLQSKDAAGDKLKSQLKEMEQEEKLKRKQLEEKLKQMQDAFEKQNALLSSSGLTEQELEEKQQQHEAAMRREKEREAKSLQERLKKQVQMKKISSKVGKVSPWCAEATEMAAEMGKDVTFRHKLTMPVSGGGNRRQSVMFGHGAVAGAHHNHKTQTELEAIKTMQVSIIAQSNSLGTEKTWTVEKFETRLFLMRDYYQKWLDDTLSDDAGEQDPFWDPREPIEIGKSFVYLTCLSLLEDMDLKERPIFDFKNKQVGTLTMGIFLPEEEGEDPLPYLDDPKEMIGMNVNFSIEIKSLKGIPKAFTRDVFCEFEFLGTRYKTEACKDRSENPQINAQFNHYLQDADAHAVDYFEHDSVTVFVYGYPAVVTQVRRSSVIPVPSGESPSRRHNESNIGAKRSAAGGVINAKRTLQIPSFDFKGTNVAAPVGAISEENEEEHDDAGPTTTSTTKTAAHVLAGMTTQPVQPQQEEAKQKAAADVLTAHAKSPWASSAAPMCGHCEELAASKDCAECQKVFCDKCFTVMHKSAKKKGHQATAIGTPAVELPPAQAAPTIMCGHCEENPAAVACEECAKSFCVKCNKVMHKAAKKVSHVRTLLA